MYRQYNIQLYAQYSIYTYIHTPHTQIPYTNIHIYLCIYVHIQCRYALHIALRVIYKYRLIYAIHIHHTYIGCPAPSIILASISSTVASPLSYRAKAWDIYGTNSRLTMNPGVSVHFTGVLPRLYIR